MLSHKSYSVYVSKDFLLKIFRRKKCKYLLTSVPTAAWNLKKWRWTRFQTQRAAFPSLSHWSKVSCFHPSCLKKHPAGFRTTDSDQKRRHRHTHSHLFTHSLTLVPNSLGYVDPGTTLASYPGNLTVPWLCRLSRMILVIPSKCKGCVSQWWWSWTSGQSVGAWPLRRLILLCCLIVTTSGFKPDLQLSLGRELMS